MQKEKDNIDQLRKRLQDCEDFILRIAKPFDGYWDKATEEVIADHLGTRKWIPNLMESVALILILIQSPRPIRYVKPRIPNIHC